MGEVGIAVEDVSLDFNAATDRVFVERDFDLGIVSYCNGDEIGVRRVYGATSGRSRSRMAPSNPAIDRLFDEAAATLDPAQRAAAYGDPGDPVEEVPYVWLIETEGLRAFSADFHDFQHWSGHFAETAWTPPSRDVTVARPPPDGIRHGAMSNLTRYILRRLLQAVPLLLGVVVVNFSLIHLAPGDPIYLLAGDGGDAAYFAAMRAKTVSTGRSSPSWRSTSVAPSKASSATCSPTAARSTRSSSRASRRRCC